MNRKFEISCESTVDFPYSYLEKRNIPVLYYSYIIDGIEYFDDMGKTSGEVENFYKKLREGSHPVTSQINAYRYEEFFEKLSSQNDLIHIAFGSGMTGSVFNAFKAAKSVMEKYPERKITVIDSYCSCLGYGMLVDFAADMRDNGDDAEKIVKWIENNCKKIHHRFFTTELKYLRKSGRVSGLAATAATVLGICPLMKLDNDGKIVAFDKIRGKKKAIEHIVSFMEEHAAGGEKYSGKCYIAHSDCISEAKELEQSIAKSFPALKRKIEIFSIGTIIASHCGPGTTAVFFFGDERE